MSDPAKPVLALPGVIGVGFEKCGTTALDSMLRTQPMLASPRGLKEVSFFRARFSLGFKYFHSLYDIRREKRYFVDFTPSYIRSDVALDRIKRHCPPETRIVICIRNPVYRAFSHYIHDLRRHHAVFDKRLYGQGEPRFSKPYSLSFFDDEEHSEPRHFTAYTPFIKNVQQRFSPARVKVLVLEEDFADLERLTAQLRDFLDVDLALLQRATQENRMDFPRYLFHPDRPIAAFVDGQRHETVPGRLYVAASDLFLLLGVQDKGKINRILHAASRWSTHLPAAEARRLFEQYFAEDFQQLRALLGRDIPSWQNFKDVSI